MKPFYQDHNVTLFNADFREVLPVLGEFDAIITDPPYAETGLTWDVWPDQWPEQLKRLAPSMWCFGSMRMFKDRFPDFKSWKMSQDVVWEKHNGSGMSRDRFRRVHEFALHFYQGDWSEVYKKQVLLAGTKKANPRRRAAPTHYGHQNSPREAHQATGELCGERSVIYCNSCHGYAVHPTQKPEGILEPLIEYSVPPGGRVFDPFAGSGTTLLVAAKSGRHAVGVEQSREYCERIADRLLRLRYPLLG